ncbi:hypothetical protein JWG44_08050 [Leptospira sp. 201903071]|uniref:hypothetical protein n=1 Tax=Leptospira ainazelensis TaxID=2810034 RepID=UPI0019646F04|nr:hypothetical protein [Leptospira ainazelensis]MBM9500199.1 hypothetical protein [Leptospira ainazelensis]
MDFLRYSILLVLSSFLEIKILENFLQEKLDLKSRRNAVFLSILPSLIVFITDHEWTWSIAKGLKMLDDTSGEFVQSRDLTIAFALFFWHLNIGFYAVRLLEKKLQKEMSTYLEYDGEVSEG